MNISLLFGLILLGSLVSTEVITDCTECPDICFGPFDIQDRCCGIRISNTTVVCSTFCLQKDYFCCGCNEINGKYECFGCPEGNTCVTNNTSGGLGSFCADGSLIMPLFTTSLFGVFFSFIFVKFF